MASYYPLLPYEHGRGRAAPSSGSGYPMFGSPLGRIGRWNPGSNPLIRSRVSSAAGGLPPLGMPSLAPASSAAGGGAPPPGYGDLLSSLLSGLSQPQSGITPEEGLASARRAVIQYGFAPNLSGLHNLGGAFDSGTQALANENTASGISLLARMNQAHMDQQRYIPNRLNAHGILASGETGYQLGREQTNYARAQADSSAQLLDYLTGINSGIAQFLQWQALMHSLQQAGAGGQSGGISDLGPLTGLDASNIPQPGPEQDPWSYWAAPPPRRPTHGPYRGYY